MSTKITPLSVIGPPNRPSPVPTLTTPEDIGEAIANIGLFDSHWMTGNTIRLDGGEDISGS